jgi:hypothetical protein
MVAAADGVEAGLLGGDRLLDQLAGTEALMAKRHRVGQLIGLAAAGPEDAAD